MIATLPDPPVDDFPETARGIYEMLSELPDILVEEAGMSKAEANAIVAPVAAPIIKTVRQILTLLDEPTNPFGDRNDG